MWFPNRSDTNRPVQSQKMGRDWIFLSRKKRNGTILVAKTKTLFTAKLICVPVFAYANCWFSHEAAHFYTYYTLYKTTICIGENKAADQLRGNREADQRLCFRYMDSTFPPLLIPKIFKILGFFCDRTGWFVSDLVGNPEDRFSHVAAHIVDYDRNFQEVTLNFVIRRYNVYS